MTGTSEPSTRTRLTALAGLAGCGALAVQPLIGLPSTGGTPAGQPGRAATTALAILLVGAAVLLVHRSARFWAPVLLLGALLVCLTPLVQHGQLQYQGIVVPAGLAAGRPIALIGVLAVAQALYTGAEGLRRTRSGIAIAGAAVGAAWILPPGAVLAGVTGDRPGPDVTVLVPMLLGVAGGLLAVLVEGAVLRRPQAQQPEGPGRPGADPDRGPLLRSAVAGTLAVALPLLISLAGPEQLARLVGVPADSLIRNGWIQLLLVGLALLAGGLLCGAVAGPRVLLTATLTAAVGVAGLGAAGLVTLSMSAGNDPATGPALTTAVVMLGGLAGLAAGAAVAGTRYRAWPAALTVAGAAAALLLAWVATGGAPEKIIQRQATLPVLVLHAVLVAAVTATASAVAPLLVRRGTLAVALGPVLGLFLFGGQDLWIGWAFGSRAEIGYLGLSTGAATVLPGALLLAAATVGLLVLAAVQLRSPAEPDRPPEPQGQGTPPATSSATETPDAGSPPERGPDRSW